MHHPGPPRFVAAGDSVELAPRDPDPEATYTWQVKSAPASSRASLGTDAVEHFVPDEPGRYAVELDAPDGIHELTIRAFPGDLRPVDAPAEGASGVSGRSGFSGASGVSGVSGMAGASGSGSGARGGDSGGGGGRPRIQLRARVEGDAVVVEADPRPNPNSDADPADLGVEFLLDDRDDVSEGDVEIGDRTVRIPLSKLSDRVRVHAVAIDDSYSVPDSISIERDPNSGDLVSDGGVEAGTVEDGGVGGDGIADGGVDLDSAASNPSEGVEVVRLNDPPEWSKSVTLYEIYVRGFAADDEEAETTFEALEKRLDYLADLGVDCLWLTPVLQNDHAPHGYNITDFFSVAADLGTREDYESFVEAAHDRGMKVLFDLVLNHSAREHPFFRDAYGNPDSEYYDWYEWQENGEPGTYFDWEYIANFNFDNLEVRRHLLDAVDAWFELVDGFRCDMAWAVPQPFWRELRDRVKERDRDFLLLDETIPYIADFHDGMFDVHFDTTLYFTLRQVGSGHEPAEAILDAIEQRTEVGFPDHASFMLYQENHDETRYVGECGEPAAFASAGALFTLPGVPMLYGGQELGQLGRRDPLAWEHANEELRDHYESLIETRNEVPALRFAGDFRRVDYESDSDEAVAFARIDGDEGYVVALHFGEGAATVSVDPDVGETDVVSGESVVESGALRVDDVAVVPIR
ncbi:alpha-amylase MalA [Halegenticoccus soli]|uniref:alpha-amylase MalA n=1 Tax=Halegenticoccus soli TaxID=1985678 RepID=UPI000C6CDCEA|nr:alpha-amylase MalA [Halegenticoccus soli]